LRPQPRLGFLDRKGEAMSVVDRDRLEAFLAAIDGSPTALKRCRLVGDCHQNGQDRWCQEVQLQAPSKRKSTRWRRESAS
jgi:hypothetical protein